MSAFKFGWLTQQEKISGPDFIREINTRLRGLVHDFESGTVALTTRATTFASTLAVLGSSTLADRVNIGGGVVGGTDGVLTISSTYAGSGRDLISLAGTVSGAGNPLGVYCAPTFNITGNGQSVGGVGATATLIAKGAFTTLEYYALGAFDPSAVSGAGTITTAYGLKVGDITVGVTNYAIYTNAGIVHFGGRVDTVAGAAGGAGLRIPHGAAPTSPVNGDIWTTTAGLFVRINGATVGPLS